MSADGNRILPAEIYGETRNFENPELYVVFPFKFYGLGKPNIDIALNTYNVRLLTQLVKFTL